MDTKLLKQKILDLAIHGKLVPQNPNDESATVLLEKIRAEKAEKIKKGELKADKNDSYIFVGDDNRHYEKFADGTVKDIEDEIPFDVSEGWAWCKAKQLYNIRSAIRIHQSDWQSNGIPFFRGRELVELCKTGTVHPEIFISEELYEENKKKGGIPQKNDLLVSAVGTLGFVHIVEGTKKFYYKDAYILCFENHFNLNPFYMKKVIESDFIQKVIYGGSKGTTVDQLTIENAKDLWIPFPPENEQKKLVSELDRLFLLIDSIENDKLDLQTAIKQAKSKILDLAIHGKLVPQDSSDEPASVLLEKLRAEKEAKIKAGELKRDKNDSYIYKNTTDNCHYEKFNGKEAVCIDEEIPFDIPENWQWTRLGRICTKLVDGDHNPPKGTEEKTDYIMASSRNINHNTVEDLENVRYLTKEMFEIENQRTKATEGDIFFTSVGTLGRSCIYDGSLNICFQRSVSILNTQIDNNYLKYFFDSNFYQDYVVEHATGTAQLGFYLQEMSESYIAIPPISEQKRIVSKIEEMFERLDQIQNNLI
ncbi:MAG: restriction endonuclease subunit S [Treponema sp.]